VLCELGDLLFNTFLTLGKDFEIRNRKTQRARRLEAYSPGRALHGGFWLNDLLLQKLQLPTKIRDEPHIFCHIINALQDLPL
jgi:hypothetical protein